MKKQLLTLLISSLLMLIFAAPAFAQGPDGPGKFVFGENFTLKAEQTINGDLVVFGGNVTTEPGSTVNGSLVAFGGNAAIEGTVDGDVAAVGGNVTINGAVDGDVAALGGNVNIAEMAVIDGDIGTFGGRVDVAEGATVTGQFKGQEDFFDDDDDRHFDRGSSPVPGAEFSHREYDSAGSSVFGWVGRIVGDIIWTVSLLMVLALITWLVAAFMPRQMITVQRTVAGSTALGFGVGLITTVVAGVVGAVLLITICLAFIPILAYMVLAIAALFGWIVIGQMIGERLLAASGRYNSSFIFSSIVGVVVLTLLTNMPVIGEIPCLGWVLGFVGAVAGLIISLTGLGAVLLTRFGTRPYPMTGGSFSGGPSPRPTGYSGSRVRWTDPEPEVSTEDVAASEAELRAKIKAALAEADEVAEAKEKAKKVIDETPQPESPADEPDEPSPEDNSPDDDDNTPATPDQPSKA